MLLTGEDMVATGKLQATGRLQFCYVGTTQKAVGPFLYSTARSKGNKKYCVSTTVTVALAVNGIELLNDKKTRLMDPGYL